MDYDLKIVGGTIVAGSGSAGYRGDVGIVDGKVVALGNVKGQATTTVDAGDQVVCPGFFVSRVLRVQGSSTYTPITTHRFCGTTCSVFRPGMGSPPR